MRPIHLTMQAFGAYAGRQEIDFRFLRGRNFFLIHGPTGSGKTTILDAICFALYGVTSGGDRKDEQMRSDHADPALPTEVSFDFALGRRRYRIVRRPEQELRRQRGEGMVRKSQTVALYEREEDIPDEEPGRLLESRWTPAGAAVTELLGFQSDQFRQVVVIPQGKFRELLMASTRDRQAILRVLFQTQRYEALQEALKAARAGVAARLEDARHEARHILAEAQAETAGELERRREELEQEIGHLASQCEEVERGRAGRQKELDEGHAAAARLNELALACTALEALEREGPVFEQRQHELERARAAQPLVPEEAALRRCLDDLKTASRQLEETERTLAEVGHAQIEAKDRLDRETAREDERTQAREALIGLRAMAGKVKALEAARVALAQAEGELKRQNAEREKSARARDELARRAQELRGRREEAMQLASAAPALAAKAERLKELINLFARLEQVGPELDRGRRACQALEGEEAALRRQLEAARSELEATEQGWLRGQAAILARRLGAGEPCPVCGSTSHPAPAKAHGELPGEAQLRALRQAVSAGQQTLESAAATLASARIKLAGLETQQNEILGALGEQRDRNPAELKRQLQEKQAALTAAEHARDGLERVNADLAAAERETEGQEQRLAEVEEALKQALTTEAEARARAEGCGSEVPEELRKKGALEKAVVQAENRVKMLNEALEKAQHAERQAAEALVRRQAERQAATANHEELQRRGAILQNAFEMGLQRAGFARREDYAAAIRDAGQIAALERAIRRYQDDLAAARARHAAAAACAQGTAAPDLPALEAAVAEMGERAAELSRRSGALQNQAAQVARWIEALGGSARLQERLEQEYRVIGRVADVAAGTPPLNPHNLSFERFIQGVWLDRVLARASERLRRMSRERFTIKRLLDPAHGRAAAGLDLQVRDNYTGTDRPVGTLSGGESFMASLALALGLADVVQARSGGIHLETIFVDEGFGSLDPEALDLALETLIDLQQGGRLVGIISHVPELKERIDVRLEIEATRGGSRARFVSC